MRLNKINIGCVISKRPACFKTFNNTHRSKRPPAHHAISVFVDALLQTTSFRRLTIQAYQLAEKVARGCYPRRQVEDRKLLVSREIPLKANIIFPRFFFPTWNRHLVWRFPTAPRVSASTHVTKRGRSSASHLQTPTRP